MVDLKITYQVEGGSETTVGEWSTGLMSWQLVEETLNVVAPEGKKITVRFYLRRGAEETAAQLYMPRIKGVRHGMPTTAP